MKNLFLALAALALVFAFTTSAKADCTDISIGASITVMGVYGENYDYDDDTPDAASTFAEYVDVTLENTYTSKVKTIVEFTIAGYMDDATNGNVEIKGAYIQMEEFLAPNVTFVIGKKIVKWQLRPTWGAGTFEDIYPAGVNSAFIINVRPIVLQMVYDFDEDNSLTLGYGKITEVSAPGANANDLDIFYVRYDRIINEDNNFFAGLIYYNDGANNLGIDGTLWILDAGIDYFVMEENLELYFEFAYCDGDSDTATIELGAMAINAGAEYTFKDYNTTPYIGLDITYFQGVDAATLAFMAPNQDFTRTLIAENDLFGGLTNWTPGYIGIKIVGGMKSISEDKFALDFVLGFFQADGDLVPAAREDGLGWEFDIVGSYYYTEDVSFTLGFGYFDANEDLGGASPDAVMVVVFACSIVF